MTGSAKDFPRDAEEARADRDVTRQELTETLEALSGKLDVKTRLHEGIDAKLDHAQATIADKAGSSAAEKFRSGADAVRANPLPMAAGLLGILIVIRLRIRRSGA
ncbi:DUF3618 domain-containing protein [Amycolatopsis ultiminotia]|uniref:DUF3618 domain-containing protein n=1 Tax=Amycolatopsis ultiminotia TaxID=543629 RepID=A0ABP6XDU9_9PSEU